MSSNSSCSECIFLRACRHYNLFSSTLILFVRDQSTDATQMPKTYLITRASHPYNLKKACSMTHIRNLKMKQSNSQFQAWKLDFKLQLSASMQITITGTASEGQMRVKTHFLPLLYSRWLSEKIYLRVANGSYCLSITYKKYSIQFCNPSQSNSIQQISLSPSNLILRGKIIYLITSSQL